MKLYIGRTDAGIKTYPLHRHPYYEIMLYVKGEGVLRTVQRDYPFQPGTIAIVPGEWEHGSVSEDEFENISIGGNFTHFFPENEVLVLSDNREKEATALAELIWKNRYGNESYLTSLCQAYVYFLLQNLKNEDALTAAVEHVISVITEHFGDSDLDLSALLKSGGYAEDYLRSHFKKVTGKTPHEFLTGVRMDRARILIESYGSVLSLSQIAERCGYTDYVYFSKLFKRWSGVSPNRYRRFVFRQDEANGSP